MTALPLAPEATLAEQDMFSLANDLRLACQRIARRVRFESTTEVAPHQFSVLTHLRKRGPQTPTKLAAHERVSAPSMTRTINCMVDDGLVERIPHPDDKRQILVRPTQRGEEIIASTIASRDTWMLTHLDGLSDDDLATLRRASDILLEVSNA